uniref:Ribosomal protein L13 n=1 Tax=Angiostrongylus cantonensis TaxID=6313 RepID=A0A0K0DA94_ANGCA
MSARRGLSRFDRVHQWLQFARQWHIVDANHQDVFKLGKHVARHLAGKHKPIWHPETDCGDHVVVVNCRHVAMHGFDWKHTLLHFNREYPKSKTDIPAWQIHEYDPCRMVFYAVYKALERNLTRRRHIERLHLFPGTDMPDFVRENLGNQLEQVQRVPRRSDEYTAEERAQFPRLLRFPKNHVEEWERSIPNPGMYEKSSSDDKKRI